MMLKNDLCDADVMLLTWNVIHYLKRKSQAYQWALEFWKKAVVKPFAPAEAIAICGESNAGNDGEVNLRIVGE